MVKAIENKELKIDDLAKQFGFSDRTIQTKIKNLGFKWDNKGAKYSFVGTDESVFNMAIQEVFKKAISNNRKSTSKSTAKREVKQASKETATTVQTNVNNTPEVVSVIASNNKSNKGRKKDIDSIDLLLAGKKAKKEYRGFYLDSDVLSIIDNIDNGIKSELVNECLRKVFKEKGLL